ncbi:hypothetical protein [Pedobacter helvus]|uniref:Uncharacterized protein n=1 Tax=Pedobacter helvus TaxID=2563444 RepID=A0ABW9JQG2_9SPHI
MIEVKEATCGNVNEMMNKKVQLLDTKIMDMVALRNQLINGLRNVMTAVILPAQKKTARS